MYIHELKGFEWKRVCTAKRTHRENHWYYENIDRSVMFSTHTSWVYAITVNKRIVKIGETGNPLGIEAAYSYDDFSEIQPKIGTQSRLGRYRKGCGTDETIRECLRSDTKSDAVEIYAYRCPETLVEVTIVDEKVTLKSQIHKQLEKAILDKIKEKDGSYPWLNTGRC